MSSDSEKASILVETAKEYADDEAVRNTFFKAVSTLHSGGEHRRVLSALLKHDVIGSVTLVRICKYAGRISLDGEKAAVLVQATEREGTTIFLNRAGTLGSPLAS